IYSHVFAAISPQNDKPLIYYIVASGASIKLFFYALSALSCAPSINSLISASASLRSTQYTGNTYDVELPVQSR
ncbi:hypothetical protein ALC56_13765, partial [Trachymyrmex septentrionalis]